MATLDSRDRDLMEFLHRTGGGDVQSVCDLLGVTRNAVRQRLTRLEANGLIQSLLKQQKRGRPKLVYSVTADGLHSLGEDYRELAVVFWEAIVGLEDSEAKQTLISQIQNRLADRFRSRLVESATVEENLDHLATEMKSNGFNVESDHSMALPILRETNCPFPMLADVDETICQVERKVLEEVLGAPVEFRNRCRDGHHCCEFEVQVDGDANAGVSESESATPETGKSATTSATD